MLKILKLKKKKTNIFDIFANKYYLYINENKATKCSHLLKFKYMFKTN